MTSVAPVSTARASNVAPARSASVQHGTSDPLTALLVAASSSSSLGAERVPSPLTLSRPIDARTYDTSDRTGQYNRDGGDSAVLLPPMMPHIGQLGQVPVNAGWCSARMCAYPQWLVFSLSPDGGATPCHISTIQILAHNFKIPSKISILIPEPSRTALPMTDLNRVSWVEYGHLVLSTNTASNYRAREHLTIPTTISDATLVKLVLHSPHQNPLNLWRQVALLEVRFFGSTQAAAHFSARPKSPRQSTMIPPSNSHPLVAIAYAGLEVLANQKQQAVAQENYTRAAEIKTHTDQVLDLVRQLQQCAQVPNDGSAGAEMWVKRLADVEGQLRAALGKVSTLHGGSAMTQPVNTELASSLVHAAEPVTQPPTLPSHDSGALAASSSPVLSRSQIPSTTRPQSPVHQPMERAKLPALDSKLPELPSPIRAASPPVPAVANRSRGESPNVTTAQDPFAPNQSIAIDATLARPSPPPRERSDTHSPVLAKSLPRSQPRSKSRSRSRSPDLGFPSAAKDTTPSEEPELTEAQLVDFRLAIDWLGAGLVTRFLAKEFVTRERAVQDILKQLESTAWSPDDAPVVIKGAFTLIDPCMADPRERVAGWAMAMWLALVTVMGSANQAGAASLFTSLSSLQWTALIGRAADTNPRVAAPARDLALGLVTSWPSTFVPLVLKGFPGPGPWRSAWARVVLVDDSVQKVGIAITSSGAGGSLGRISPASGEGAAKQGLKKKPSVAARLGALGRSSSATFRPTTPSKAAPATAPSHATSTGMYDLPSLQEFLSRALSHTHAQVRDAAGNLLVTVAKLVGSPAVFPVIDGLEQRSQIQTLRAKVEKYAPPPPPPVHSTPSPVRNQQLRNSYQQPEPSPPRLARHQSTSHMPQGFSKSQPAVVARPLSAQGIQAVRLQQQQPKAMSQTNSPRKAQPTQQAVPPAGQPVPSQQGSKHSGYSGQAASGLPQPTARPPSILSISDKKDTGKKEKEKKGFWDRLFNHGSSGSKESKKDKHATAAANSNSTRPSVSFSDHDPMGLLGSPPPLDASFVSSSGAAAHAQDRTFDLGNSTIMSTTSVSAATTGAAQGSATAAGAVEQANETEGDWNLDFTCVFCEEVNPEFVQQRLDEHYWRECPCLCACAYCSEVVEVANMHTHLKLECRLPQARSVVLPADTCVMCRAKIGAGESAFRKHLLVGGGCAKAVRKPKLGVKYRVE